LISDSPGVTDDAKRCRFVGKIDDFNGRQIKTDLTRDIGRRLTARRSQF